MPVYQFNQGLGVGWAGGVTAAFQSAGPTLVVVNFQLKQRLVALAQQEEAVVFEAVSGIVVHPEALAFGIIVVIRAAAFPILVALDAKMVVGLSAQLAFARPTFKQSLCQRDAGRNAVQGHLAHSLIFPFVDVIALVLFSARIAGRRKKGKEQGVRRTL